MNPSSFTIAVSIYFLIAVVVGGAASIVGPAIGAVFYGVFIDIITPELPESLKPATPVILGVHPHPADAGRARRDRRAVEGQHAQGRGSPGPRRRRARST